MDKRLKCLVYIDVENLTGKEIINAINELNSNDSIRLISVKAYGNVNILGNKVDLCCSIGADIVDTSLISKTKKNLADSKIIVDCITDVFTFNDIKRVALLTKDNDFIPLATKLTSMGIRVFTMINSVNNTHNDIEITKRYLQAVGALPISSDTALQNQFETLNKYHTESITSDMIAEFLEYRRSTFIKKLSNMVPDACLEKILALDIRIFDFEKVRNIVSRESDFPIRGLAELYTSGMFGVFPPKEILDELGE